MPSFHVDALESHRAPLKAMNPSHLKDAESQEQTQGLEGAHRPQDPKGSQTHLSKQCLSAFYHARLIFQGWLKGDMLHFSILGFPNPPVQAMPQPDKYSI